ncbi:MAG TPA: SDR family oxidoreductase [Haliangiales bacterium]|nr:SDR family oxidoreductase [Haliangiales bacterium]
MTLTDEDPTPPETVLVTGFPSFTAARMVKKVLAADAGARVTMLTREKFAEAAKALAAGLADAERDRLRILVGDVSDMDLGLAGGEVKQLAAEVTTIHHLAGVYYLGVPREQAERVNVHGTQNVLELAGECRRLRRLCHWSTAAVAGKRRGVILEEELDEGQGFRNFYEETKHEAERLARAAARRLPVTIFRPGVMVGDSRTGEIDRFDGPYWLMVLIVQGPLDLGLPLPGRGVAPLHLVPVDFVVDAAYALSLDDRAAGLTFHLTDPCPFSARQVYDLVAERAQKRRPRGFIPSGLARAVMRTPGIERLARMPLAFLQSFDHLVFYNCRNALGLLEGTGIRCPSFESYVDALIRYVRDVHAERRRKLEDDVFDPFD